MREPFARQVARRCHTSALNLGHGGGKATYYLHSPSVLDYVNRGRAAIVQVMSARGIGNDLLEPVSDANISLRLTWSPTSSPMFANHAWDLIVRKFGLEAALKLAAQSQRRWLNETQRLLSLIAVPIVLVWISRRSPDWEYGTTHPPGFVGVFPQLVDRWMVDDAKRHVSAYVECITVAGEPIAEYHEGSGRVIDRRTVMYYPTQSEHDAITDSLVPVVRDLLRAQPKRSERQAAADQL